jgi:hypothetical protein
MFLHRVAHRIKHGVALALANQFYGPVEDAVDRRLAGGKGIGFCRMMVHGGTATSSSVV